MPKILLLDSYSLIYRAYYALPSMQNAKGAFTSAIYGYLSMLSRLIKEELPTHIGAVFDLKGPTFRNNMYTEYKATRKPMPDDLREQIPILKELLSYMGIPILCKEGFEADDIIGTIAKRFSDKTIILTGDKDCLQLVDESTTVYYTLRGVTNVKKYTLQSLLEENMTPALVIEHKAIAGDNADNIPGAKGIGKVSTENLLSKYGNIENIYNNIDEITGKLKEKLLESKEMVFLSKELATINTNVPLECSLKMMEFNPVLSVKARQTMQELGFKSLIERFSFSDVEEKHNSEVNAEIVEISNKEDLEKVILQYNNSSFLALLFSNVISFAFDEKTEYRIAFGDTIFDLGFDFHSVIDSLNPLMQSDTKKLFYDIKEMMYYAESENSLFDFNRKNAEDMLLKAYLVNPNITYKSIEDILAFYGFSAETPCASMLKLNEMLDKKIVQFNLQDLYYNIELPLIDVLFDIEKTGFKLDVNMLGELSSNYANEIEGIIKDIHLIAGEEFNINSNQQLGKILFDKLGLPKSKKNKTGYVVSANVLEELDHPIIKLLLRHREITKLKSVYIDGLYALINKKTGRIHTKFKQCLTTTGRLSSTEPNLQNIPTRREEGRAIRKMFISSDDNILLAGDYSQIELRLLAHFSQDESLMDAYRNNIDIHKLTASKVNDIPLNEVTSDIRRSAKEINFGIIYGMSDFGLSQALKVSRNQAKEFLDKYFKTYPKVKTFMENNVMFAKENGYITSIKNRIRFLPELKSSNYNVRSFGERAAMNMPLQGSSSDIIKVAMLNLHRRLIKEGLNAKIILQVHDELIVDCPLKEIDKVKDIMYNEMKNAVQLSVPLEVEINSGKNWFTAK